MHILNDLIVILINNSAGQNATSMRDITTASAEPKQSRMDADKCVISDPQALAAALACAVTVLSEPERLVARNGDLSIFSAYRRIFPQARFDGIAILILN